MWERCRYCGSTDARVLAIHGGEHLCPRCAASPLCDACGHQRELHVGVFRPGGKACRHVWLDVQSLMKVPCDCPGFRSITGTFRDASFAQPVDGEFTLRLAE